MAVEKKGQLTSVTFPAGDNLMRCTLSANVNGNAAVETEATWERFVATGAAAHKFRKCQTMTKKINNLDNPPR